MKPHSRLAAPRAAADHDEPRIGVGDELELLLIDKSSDFRKMFILTRQSIGTYAELLLPLLILHPRRAKCLALASHEA